MAVTTTKRTLLSASSNTESAAFQLEGRHEQTLTVYAYGTFGSSTGKVQVSDGTTNWVDHANLKLSAGGVGTLEGRFAQARGVVVGGTGNESVTLVLMADYTT